jgi:hypothetical protein
MGDGLVKLRNNFHSCSMSVIQFIPLEFNGRVEFYIVLKQFLQTGIKLFVEVKCLVKNVRLVGNAGWKFIWGNVN